MMFTYDCPDCGETYWSKGPATKCDCGGALVLRQTQIAMAPGPKPISDDARRAWNLMTQKIAIGKTVMLDNRDLQWLLEIGAGAVSWHESQGAPAPKIATTENPKPRKGKQK